MAANKSSAMSAVKRAVAEAAGRGRTPGTGSAPKDTPASTTTGTKRTTAKKSTQKKTTGSATAKKATTKKTATKRAPAKQTATVKTTSAKKATTKKATTKKATPAKKAPAKKATTKKTTPAKKAPAKKVTAKSTPAKKATAKKVTAKSTPAKKSTAKKVTAKSTPAKMATAKKAAVKKPTTPSMTGGRAVDEGEKSWSAAELRELRAALEQDRERLITEIAATEEEISHLLREGGEGAGNDQADVGSNTFERDHEMSMAKNSRENLELVEGAIARIDKGSYGVCESCGGPIGKMRLQAFPRATLCLECKQRQERR